MEYRKMIEVMVAAVNALGNNEIADDLMEVATTCEELWANEIQEEEDERWVLFMITSNEFINLGKGDMIQYKVGDVLFRTKCIGDAFYNADADEPGWEIETEDCNLSMYNDIVIEKKHEPKEFMIQLTLTENDIEALEDKVGYSIENNQDAYEAVCEAISTFIEL